MYRAYWNMEYNPFSKEIVINKMYKTEDFKEAITRLEFLEKTRGIGLFTGVPGTGKTYTIKFFLENLNPGLYKIIYLPLTSVSVIDFYRALCIELNLEPKGSKTKMFYEIQENIKKIVKEQKKHLIIAIDEVQLLKPEVLTDLKILFNFEMDSINMATVILIGLPVINHILSRSTNEDLNQRIVMNYDFKGLSKEDIRGYVSDRLNLVKVDENIFSDNVFEILPNLVNGSIRKLNLIIERVLRLGAIEKVGRIGSELIMKAVNDISLV